MPLSDIFRIVVPNQILWSNQNGLFGFLDVYDWDTISLHMKTPLNLNFNLNLCTGIFPCTVKIHGDPHGIIQRGKRGSIICLETSGCSGILIVNVSVICSCDHAPYSVLKVQGSGLAIAGSTFLGCQSETDGGVIQSYDQADVSVHSSQFKGVYSFGHGGAVSAFGSQVSIVLTSFENCSSLKGGGAIWASAFETAYGSLQKANTSLMIERAHFEDCSSNGPGGAIWILSSYVGMDEYVNIQIHNSIFRRCNSNGNGGAVRAEGRIVSSVISESTFIDCRTLGSGGAISANAGSLDLHGNWMKRNSAEGLGGGALHMQNTELSMYKMTFEENVAIAGGGGILYWMGALYPLRSSICPSASTESVRMCVPISNTVACAWHTCVYQNGSDKEFWERF